MPSVPTATTMGASRAGSVKPALQPCRWTGHRCHSWSTVGTVRAWVRTGLPPALSRNSRSPLGRDRDSTTFQFRKTRSGGRYRGRGGGPLAGLRRRGCSSRHPGYLRFSSATGGRSFRRDHPHTANAGAATGRRSGAGSEGLRCDGFVAAWYRRGTGRRLRCRLARGDDVDTRTTSSYGYGHVATRGQVSRRRFVRLRAFAFAQGLPLSEAAKQVVTRRLDFAQEDG